MFRDSLKKLRKQKGITQGELAKALSLSKSAISMYENGQREPDFETLETIADYFNVNMDYLTGRSSQKSITPSNIIPLPVRVNIPLIGTIACGKPILATENIERMIFMPDGINADFALLCKGDSMINARIFDGDVVYIKEQPDVDDGTVAAVLIGDEATLKRVYHYPNRIVLRACNPVYDDMVFTDSDLDTVRILGKAVAFLSAVR